MQPRPVISPETPAGADLSRPTAVANSTALGGMAVYGALSWPKQAASMAGVHLTFMSMRIDAPDLGSAIRQPTDNIPPKDVIRTFMATRPTPDGHLRQNENRRKKRAALPSSNVYNIILPD